MGNIRVESMPPRSVSFGISRFGAADDSLPAFDEDLVSGALVRGNPRGLEVGLILVAIVNRLT